MMNKSFLFFMCCLLHIGSSAAPNIVLILADDLGVGDIKAYNSDSKIPTPNLNQLSKEGILFTDAHSPSAICTPTRYSILTGKYGWRSSLKSGVLDGYSPSLIDEGQVTLPMILSENGYHTAGIGKWHLGIGDQLITDFGNMLRPGPISHGFDYYYGIPASLDMPPYIFFENETVLFSEHVEIEGSRGKREGGNGYWRSGLASQNFRHESVLPTLFRKAEEYISQRKSHPNQPFFLYFPLTAPHTPWLPSDEFIGKSGAGPYGDFVTEMDWYIGNLLNHISENGFSDNTIIIFASDNGAHWTDDDKTKYSHHANNYLRGQKGDIWEGGHKIPLIIKWMGTIKPNTENHNLVSLVDLFSTIVQVAGVKKAYNMQDSISFAEIFNNKFDLGSQAREFDIQHSYYGVFAIRIGDWKYIEGAGSGGFVNPDSAAKGDSLELGQLYNLRFDPYEQRNLFNQFPEVVEKMALYLNKIRDEKN